VPHHVIRVLEVDEHEPAFCHAHSRPGVRAPISTARLSLNFWASRIGTLSPCECNSHKRELPHCAIRNRMQALRRDLRPSRPLDLMERISGWPRTPNRGDIQCQRFRLR
jgi:hypothetical protein